MNLDIPISERRFLAESNASFDAITIEDHHIVKIKYSIFDYYDLGFNDMLMILPASIGNLTELRELDLSGHFLRELPEEIGSLSKLKSLRLSNNLLVSLPDIGKLSRLDELDLSENHLESLPETIGLLADLRILNLENTRRNVECYCGYSCEYNDLFESVLLQFDQIATHKLYDYLNLHQNHLTVIPESVGNLTNLRRLLLAGNWLTTLPDTIGNLQKLEFLDLHNNILETLPETIKNLQSLRRLHIWSPISQFADIYKRTLILLLV